MSTKFFAIALLCGLSALINAAPAPEPGDDGKYRPSKNIKSSEGQYVPTKNEGRYVPMHWPYMHIHDNRELGRYVHIHNPYGGGYGPYSGDIDKYRYEGDSRGDYSLYTVSKRGDNDPFETQVYEIPKPDILLEYGFPDHTPTTTSTRAKRSIETSHLNKNKNTLSKNLLVPNKNGRQEINNILDSQTTTTTTPKPRIRYDDEGKWRIIRQEEAKKPQKYDYLYLTENGIYAEEQAKTVNQDSEATGTNGKGYYYYTGDDGEQYMVVYTAGEQGFLPMADHLHPQLKKALDFLAAKDKAEAEAQRLGK